MATPPVRAHPLFPTTIFDSRLPHHEELNRRFEKRIRQLRQETPLWKGRESPWQCAPRLHEHPTFQPLVEAIDAAMRAIVQAMAYDVEGWSITGMWATWLRAGEVHPPHGHANNAWSGVYYVRSPRPTEAPVTFLHPTRAADVLRPRIRAYNELNSTLWAMPSEEGLMLLFPAYLLHWVPPAPEDRISVAFNVQWRGELGFRDDLQWSRI